jgi:hypothetical protein
MDIDLERRVNEAIEQLRKLSVEDINLSLLDPVAKMMLVALVNEVQKIQDYIDSTAQRIAERYCTDFIPHREISAVPAITLINPLFRPKKDTGIISVGTGDYFSYKKKDSKIQINYIPLFNTSLLPYSDLYILTSNRMSYSQGVRDISMDKSNHVWIGITTKTEIESVQDLSLLISGTNGVLPERIFVGVDNKPIDFSTMKEMENIDMAEPFDAQQSSGQFFSFISVWKENLLNMKDTALIYLTDKTHDRDLFKPRAYPRVFQQWLEDETLDCFDANTLWLQLEFPEGYSVPDTCNITANVLPVVNVDVNSLTLTQASPIAKLQNKEDSFFLSILETSSLSHKQGFNMNAEEIIVRDFDASCYNNGSLYRYVRNLYNRFIDDYYAFIEYNGIKDGEVLKQLRETINRVGKSVGESNAKFKFDSGTYVMKNMNQFPTTSSTKVSYLTTLGAIGNTPQVGETMENKKLPAIEQKVNIVVSAMGGTDKVSADKMYEQLRYYSLTNDRLYTKMDIEAFLRNEVMTMFGKEEFKRIFIRLNVEGAGGPNSLQRGLYIDIEFKDKKNYEKAVQNSFDNLTKQKIEGKSCISMPIIVKLHNLEKQDANDFKS